MIEPTDEMLAAFRDASDNCTGDACLLTGLTAVLAIVERDQAPTQDAYAAAVRALEKYRARATIHADTLLTIHGLLDEYRGAKALREGVRTAIQQGAQQIDELLTRATARCSSPGGGPDA